MYLQNKYTVWYYSIIDNAKLRSLPKDTYIEKHHIIPRSMGGDDHNSNLVNLTAREHYICHYLLTKMTIGMDKVRMFCALRFLNANNQKSARVYEYIKTNLRSGPLSDLLRQKIPNTMKGRPAKNKGVKYPFITRKKWTESRLAGVRTGVRTNGKLKGRVRPRLDCPHCHKNIDEANYHRYHGPKCKSI